ncbi:CopD family protein [Peptococcaceae bacterium 1198_IL3148]
MNLANLMNLLHYVGITTWIGGMIFMMLVLTPAVGGKGVPPQFLRLMGIQRFRNFAWGSIALLLISGSYQLIPRLRYQGWELFSMSRYGQLMTLKLTLVAIMIIITAVVSFYMAKRIPAMAPAPGEQPSVALMNMQKQFIVLSNANLVLGLVILFIMSIIR